MLADLFHQSIVEIQVVHDGKSHSEHLFCFEKMSYIGTCVMPAYRTVTLIVDRGVVGFIFRVIDIDDPVPCEKMTVSGVA